MSECEMKYTVLYEGSTITLQYSTSSEHPNSLERFYEELSMNENLSQDDRSKFKNESKDLQHNFNGI
eukprot:07154.XXX_211866_212137_1 [CDS] Oithona nana genome sequencing.